MKSTYLIFEFLNFISEFFCLLDINAILLVAHCPGSAASVGASVQLVPSAPKLCWSCNNRNDKTDQNESNVAIQDLLCSRWSFCSDCSAPTTICKHYVLRKSRSKWENNCSSICCQCCPELLFPYSAPAPCWKCKALWSAEGNRHCCSYSD